MRHFWGLTLGFALVLLSGATTATELKVRADRPEVYVVKKGDTLWDISELLLSTPWLWPQLWQANPQVDNPHLIYPGDRLYLTFINGKPRLMKKPVVKLSPHIRTIEHETAIDVIPFSVIEPYLSREQIVSLEQYESLPYVLGNNEGNTRSYQGQHLFARGSVPKSEMYGIYHVENKMERGGDHAAVGIRLSLVATAKAEMDGKLISLNVAQGSREIRQGDRLLALSPSENLRLQYIPHPPEMAINGQIIGSHNNTQYLGSHDVVILDRGTLDGLKPGHTLAVYERGIVVSDDGELPVYLEDAGRLQKALGSTTGWDTLELPPTARGYVMVFRTFDHFSYALIMRAGQQLNVLDEVRSLQ